MPKKGRDISRGRKLTAEEVARYKRIREEAIEAVPPATMNVVKDTTGRLRQLREGQGPSLKDMEEQTGMTRANRCRLENESRNVQLRTLERYARALGCQLEVHFVPAASNTSSR